MITRAVLLFALVVIAGTARAQPYVAQPTSPNSGYTPGYQWRDQRGENDWRNNTWREDRVDENWRNRNWQTQRILDDWRQRQDYS